MASRRRCNFSEVHISRAKRGNGVAWFSRAMRSYSCLRRVMLSEVTVTCGGSATAATAGAGERGAERLRVQKRGLALGREEGDAAGVVPRCCRDEPPDVGDRGGQLEVSGVDHAPVEPNDGDGCRSDDMAAGRDAHP